MDVVLILVAAIAVWQVLRARYQRGHIVLLGSHLAGLKIEQHMETLTQGYTRAIHEASESRQLQVLETYAQTERIMASQIQALANGLNKAGAPAASMGVLPFCVPHIETVLPRLARDFRELLRIHAIGIRRVVDNDQGWDAKSRAFHLSAELYLFQHSCHWFCKSRLVADARLVARHQVTHQKVLESVSDATREAYQRWLQG